MTQNDQTIYTANDNCYTVSYKDVHWNHPVVTGTTTAGGNALIPLDIDTITGSIDYALTWADRINRGAAKWWGLNGVTEKDLMKGMILSDNVLRCPFKDNETGADEPIEGFIRESIPGGYAIYVERSNGTTFYAHVIGSTALVITAIDKDGNPEVADMGNHTTFRDMHPEGFSLIGVQVMLTAAIYTKEYRAKLEAAESTTLTLSSTSNELIFMKDNFMFSTKNFK